jgi:hypothetical protein
MAVPVSRRAATSSSTCNAVTAAATARVHDGRTMRPALGPIGGATVLRACEIVVNIKARALDEPNHALDARPEN